MSVQKTPGSPTTRRYSPEEKAQDVYVQAETNKLNAHLQREDTCPCDSGDTSVMHGCGYDPVADDPVDQPR